MTTKLQHLLEELDELSPDELLTVLERTTQQLRKSVSPNGSHKDLASMFLPKKTPEQARTELIEIFGPEEWARIEASLDEKGVSDLPELPKSLSEYLIEEREGRY